MRVLFKEINKRITTTTVKNKMLHFCNDRKVVSIKMVAAARTTTLNGCVLPPTVSSS